MALLYFNSKYEIVSYVFAFVLTLCDSVFFMLYHMDGLCNTAVIL